MTYADNTIERDIARRFIEANISETDLPVKSSEELEFLLTNFVDFLADEDIEDWEWAANGH